MTAEAFSATLRSRIADLAMIVTSALIAMALAIDAADRGLLHGDELFWTFVLAALGCGMLWWRRRHPVRVALLLLPLAAVTVAVGGAALFAVYTVAALRRGRITLLVPGLHVLAVVPYAYLRPDPSMPLRDALLLTAALLTVAVALGRRVRTRAQLVSSLRELVVRTGAEAELRAERTRSLERERIAREMHDVLAHRLSLVSLSAGALSLRRDLTPAEVAMVAATIQTGAHEALEDLREILGVLRAGGAAEPIRPTPGLTELSALIDECRAAGTPVELDDRLPPLVTPSTTGRTVYRLVQEGLTNARKYAPGAPVRIGLERTAAGELHVRLSNPLRPADRSAVPGSGAGLIGLAERVSLVGGRLEHGARRTADGVVAFHLEGWIPWPK